MKPDLPPLPEGFEYRLDLAKHVTPRLIKDQPVHRWFYFPHSFSPQLVSLLLDEWQTSKRGLILDPFVGAGTTLRVAAERGHNTLGIDVSPLSIFVSNAKLRRYDPVQVREALHEVEAFQGDFPDVSRTERLQRAFTDAEFAELTGLRRAIQNQPEEVRPILLLALLRTQQSVSRARPDGGWFRWIEHDDQSEVVRSTFAGAVESMLEDLDQAPALPTTYAEARQHDARFLADVLDGRGKCEAIITSPPYPNRHDYSRIFQIELLTLGLDESDIFDLRYNSMRSHVEAHPPARAVPAFQSPPLLEKTLAELPEKLDRRIMPMLCGYFEDMNAVLSSAYESLVPGGRVALVVGNVRHAGVMIPVDTILIEIGRELGYLCEVSWVARLRGNSAQQMGRYGREPARESIVILRKR